MSWLYCTEFVTEYRNIGILKPSCIVLLRVQLIQYSNTFEPLHLVLLDLHTRDIYSFAFAHYFTYIVRSYMISWIYLLPKYRKAADVTQTSFFAFTYLNQN